MGKNQMPFILLLLFIFGLFTNVSFAENLHLNSPADCGDYLVFGVLRIRPEGMRIVVHEKTQSEQLISLNLDDQSAIATHLNFPITVGLLLDKKFDGTNGYASAITKKIEIRAPNPLIPNEDTGYKLIKKSKCKTK